MQIQRLTTVCIVTASLMAGAITPGQTATDLSDCGGISTSMLAGPQGSPESTDGPNARLRYYTFEPRVIDLGTTTTVTLTVLADDNPTAVEIDPDDGSPNIPLTWVATDTWEVTLTTADVTAGYLQGDLHSVVGGLEFYDGAMLTQRINLIVNVRDATVPNVAIMQLDTDAQASPFVVNLRDDVPLLGSNPRTSSTLRFYDFFEDGVDFIAVVGNVSPVANRTYTAVRNATSGIGRPLFDNGATWGSPANLDGVIMFPVGHFYDMAITATSHEIGHRWINFLSGFPPLGQAIPHWPLSDSAHGIMGQNLAGGVGGEFPWIITEDAGTFTVTFVGPPREFNDLELYLMGLAPPEDVAQHFVFDNQTQDICCLEGPVTFFDADDIIAAEGPRIPSVATSQKFFRAATVVLSSGRLLYDHEMAFFDHMSARGQATSELPFTSGLAFGTTKPFLLATLRRAALGTATPCRILEISDGDGDSLRDCEDNCTGIFNPGQADVDDDGFGDSCDNCPAIFNYSQQDADADQHGDRCDNCASLRNPLQADSEGDDIGNVCDVCPGAFDPGQEDADGDGEGDACDCEPADPNDLAPRETSPLAASPLAGGGIRLSWPAQAGADAYSVLRGDVGGLPLGLYGSCLAQGVTTLTQDDAALPAAGTASFYLVHAENFDCGSGPLGFTSAEEARVNLDSGACGGTSTSDAGALSESTLLGSISAGSFVDTAASDDIVEELIEEQTGGNPSTRVSQLEHHWTIDVPAGSIIELHVEGFRSASLDGDEFIFEYSTDGGSIWQPISLPSLPLADDDIDLVAPLPASVSGSTLFRVTDTDRTPGNGDLDTVSIDALFVRSVP